MYKMKWNVILKISMKMNKTILQGACICPIVHPLLPGVWKHWANYSTFWLIFTTLVLFPIYFVYSSVSIYWTFSRFIIYWTMSCITGCFHTLIVTVKLMWWCTCNNERTKVQNPRYLHTQKRRLQLFTYCFIYSRSRCKLAISNQRTKCKVVIWFES